VKSGERGGQRNGPAALRHVPVGAVFQFHFSHNVRVFLDREYPNRKEEGDPFLGTNVSAVSITGPLNSSAARIFTKIIWNLQADHSFRPVSNAHNAPSRGDKGPIWQGLLM
jgi:hypothetical protein